MSASDNLSHELFHGTDANLKPGDIVTPQEDEDYAFATNDPHFASDYGRVYKVEPIDKEDLVDYKHDDAEATHYMSKKGFRVIK